MTGLGARVHLFVHPDVRERFRTLFEEVLGLSVIERDFGMEYPITLVRFPDGSAFSVELSELAPVADPGPGLDDEHAFRGAWIEFRTTDVAGCQERLRHRTRPARRRASKGARPSTSLSK